MGRVEGKVAFITGAARGQGRSHAIRLAEEGADIIALDLCAPVEGVVAPASTPDDLEQTVKLVEETGRSIRAFEGDVRDGDRVAEIVAAGLESFGHIDIVIANAGIATVDFLWELDEAKWQTMIDINLTGVWKTVKAAVPSMIERGAGGSVIMTSSAAGLAAIPRLGHYSAAKHGVTGLARAFAVELAPYGIRANSIHPGNVNSPMINNPSGFEAFTGSPDTTEDQFRDAMMSMNAMATPWAEVEDISDAVLFLASEESRWVTGTQLVVDAGNILPFKIPHGAV